MNIILSTVFGSHLYGLSTPLSDRDYKHVFIPTDREIILGHKQIINLSTGGDECANTKDDVDNEYISLAKFIQLLSTGDTMCLNVLHAPDDCITVKHPIWDYIRANRADFYSLNMQGAVGYCRAQYQLYSVKGKRYNALVDLANLVAGFDQSERLSTIVDKLPVNSYMHLTDPDLDKDHKIYYNVMGNRYMQTISIGEFHTAILKMSGKYGARTIKANDGHEWKSISHALRVMYELIEIYETGDLHYPLKNREFLLDVKLGKYDMVKIDEIMVSLMDKLDSCINSARIGGLREVVDVNKWENFVYETYKNCIINA